MAEKKPKSAMSPTEIARQLKGNRGPAPVHLWEPELCGEMDIRIARDGTWFYMGSPIGRKSMVKLFSSILRHDEDGIYYMVTPAEKMAIKVDDAPFVVVGIEVTGEGAAQNIRFRTHVDDEFTVDNDHAIRIDVDPETGEPSPYVLVRGRLEALINRAVFYDLVELGVEEERDGETCLGIWSGGEFFSFGNVNDWDLDEDAA